MNDEMTPVYYSIEVAADRSGLRPTTIRRCVTYGFVTPTRSPETDEVYTETELAQLRRVHRLIRDLGLNWAGVDVALRLTNQIERMQTEIAQLRAEVRRLSGNV